MSWSEGLQAHCPDSKEGDPGVNLVAGASCLPSSHCGEAGGPKTPLRPEGKPKGERRGEGRGAVRLRLTQRRPRERPAPPDCPDSDPDFHLGARVYDTMRSRSLSPTLSRPAGHARTVFDLTLGFLPPRASPPPLLQNSEGYRKQPIRRLFIETGKLRPRAQKREARSLREPGTAPERGPGLSWGRPHAQFSAVQSSGLTSSTTRPSGCPSAPTSRYTSGFPAEEDGSRALLPLQARAAGKRSGKERGTGSSPSRRGQQRSASITVRVGSGRGTRPVVRAGK